MTKKIFVCPHCAVQVKHLPQHIRRMHPGEDKPSKQDKPARSHHKKAEETKPDTKGRKLDLKTPPKKEEKTTNQGYHCIDCGGPVTKGQNRCRCGATLDWRGLL